MHKTTILLTWLLLRIRPTLTGGAYICGRSTRVLSEATVFEPFDQNPGLHIDTCISLYSSQQCYGVGFIRESADKLKIWQHDLYAPSALTSTKVKESQYLLNHVKCYQKSSLSAVRCIRSTCLVTGIFPTLAPSYEGQGVLGCMSCFFQTGNSTCHGI